MESESSSEVKLLLATEDGKLYNHLRDSGTLALHPTHPFSRTVHGKTISLNFMGDSVDTVYGCSLTNIPDSDYGRMLVVCALTQIKGVTTPWSWTLFKDHSRNTSRLAPVPSDVTSIVPIAKNRAYAVYAKQPTPVGLINHGILEYHPIPQDVETVGYIEWMLARWGI